MKILFLAANPVDVVTRLRIDREIREITRRIRSAPMGNQIEIVSEWAVRANDLQEAFLRHKPDIMHFSGHCTPYGIVLEDDDGMQRTTSTSSFVELFTILKSKTRMVVFNACYGKEQARALATTVDFTIGMDGAIDDRAAVVFSSHFYQSLAYGNSLKDAFEMAVKQFAVEGIEVECLPALFERNGASAARYRIIGSASEMVERIGQRRAIVFLIWLLACAALGFFTIGMFGFERDKWGGIRWLLPSLILLLAIACTVVVSQTFRNDPLREGGDLSATNANQQQSVFASHTWHALTTCGIYASLYAEALLLEVSYDFDKYGETVFKTMPLAFGWILLTSIIALAVERILTLNGRRTGLWICLLIFLAASVALCLQVVPTLPPTAITQARFQTHTAQAAYLKDSGLFLMLAILFTILPLHVVTGLERDINAGHTNNILGLIAGDKVSVITNAAPYIKPRSLGFLLAIIIIWNLVVRAYILDQLVPSQNMNLFMKVYYVHLFLFLALPAYCLAWYYRAINEIRRRCLESRSGESENTFTHV